jgi:hypothetical protein
MKRTTLSLALAALVGAILPGAAHAGPFDTARGFAPIVPVSAFARPAGWLDPSRLHFSTTVSVGSTLGGGTGALQVTTLHYQFGAPVALSVSLGNAWGPGRFERNGAPFLEGLDLAYRPNGNTFLRFRYQNVRSPLQLARDRWDYAGWDR